MAEKKHKKEETPGAKDTNADIEKKEALKAHKEAEKDIDEDFDLSDPDPTDDLDEGELARRDNSNG